MSSGPNEIDDDPDQQGRSDDGDDASGDACG